MRYKLLGGLAVRRACYGVLRFVMESGECKHCRQAWPQCCQRISWREFGLHTLCFFPPWQRHVRHCLCLPITLPLLQAPRAAR